MGNNTDPNPASKWLSVPLIATITRLLCRELTLQNEYLRRENKILKSKINKKIVFTDDESRTLVESALAMGKDLMEKVVTIVQPKTIFAWQRKLEKEKGIGNSIPAEYKSNGKRQGGTMPIEARHVIRKDFLGGLLKSYTRKAA